MEHPFPTAESAVVVAESFAAGAFGVAWTGCQVNVAVAAIAVPFPAFEPEAPATVEFEADFPTDHPVGAVAVVDSEGQPVVVFGQRASVAVVVVAAAAK